MWREELKNKRKINEFNSHEVVCEVWVIKEEIWSSMLFML